MTDLNELLPILNMTFELQSYPCVVHFFLDMNFFNRLFVVTESVIHELFCDCPRLCKTIVSYCMLSELVISYQHIFTQK